MVDSDAYSESELNVNDSVRGQPHHSTVDSGERIVVKYVDSKSQRKAEIDNFVDESSDDEELDFSGTIEAMREMLKLHVRRDGLLYVNTMQGIIDHGPNYIEGIFLVHFS